MNKADLKKIGINEDLYYLMQLIEKNNYQEVKAILEKTPSLIKDKYRDEDEDGAECLLVKAINCGSLDCAKILIKHGSNVDYVIGNMFHNNNSLLHLSLKLGEFDIARLLIENGAQIWQGDYSVDFCRYKHDKKFLVGGFLTKDGYTELVNNFKLGINPVPKK